MKHLILIALALNLTACAHETTELDREALLMIIDNAKPLPQQAPVIITPAQTAPPVVNVNNYSGQAPVQPPIRAMATTSPSGAYQDQPAVSACTTSPRYDISGQFQGNITTCY